MVHGLYQPEQVIHRHLIHQELGQNQHQEVLFVYKCGVAVVAVLEEGLFLIWQRAVVVDTMNLPFLSLLWGQLQP
jgi:hypothetical protein